MLNKRSGVQSLDNKEQAEVETLSLKKKKFLTKYKNLMKKENFLLHKHIGDGSKNTNKDTQTWNIKKNEEQKKLWKRNSCKRYLEAWGRRVWRKKKKKIEMTKKG